MKNILLSMQPFWTEQIMSGTKIYEYRNKFANEPLIAYLYVSKPVQEISGIIKLGRRELVSDWYEQYKNDDVVRARIEEYQDRKNKYAMPVLSYQRTTGIKLETILQEHPDFLIPQSYYYLDELPLFDLIKSRLVPIEEERINDFSKALPDEVCRKYR